ncbi:DUF364 domain-containing protein [Clostridium ljungdahlii]|uniref:Heavy-metal chelation domain-containing protein n=1 Tax=Clostridium ljungdahlii TaxID=1538 RepID=A0A168R9A8_9CLOT|nr:DUF364 domain-containing protein [Clostridium ljungdahlii]OAA90378.1 hypothetical protein WY13_01281 [Clostridium ljungdahlii]
MWEIYDELIKLIPKDLVIKDFAAGLNWFLVESVGTGMAMTPKEGNSYLQMAGNVVGMKVCEAAKLIKSWSNYEAALGLAAINSVINTPYNVEKLSGIKVNEQPKISDFEYMKDKIKGKKVAVIGHFPDLEPLAEICKLSILERIPQKGDFPDPSCEYLLPEQDFVFITGTTLINKTLPRLLQLSKNAYVTVVGPSTPLTKCLYKYGINMLAGTVVMERNRVWNLIREGGCREFFNNGALMVKVPKDKIGQRR